MQTQAVFLASVIDESRHIENLKTLYHGFEAETVVCLHAGVVGVAFGEVFAARIIIGTELVPKRAARIFPNIFVREHIAHELDCRKAFGVGFVFVAVHLRAEDVPRAV